MTMEDVSETDYSLTLPTPKSSLTDSPFQVSTPLTIAPPLTNAIDTANTLLSAATTSSDFAFQYSVISRALAVGQSVAEQIVNPLSVFRPGRDDIASAKEVLQFSHAAMIQLLCRENYFFYRDQIYDHLGEIIRLQGQQLMCMDDPRVRVAFHSIKEAVDASGLSVSKRIIEWRRMGGCISLPDDEYFIGLKFWSHMSVLKMEMENVEKALADGEFEEVKAAVLAQQDVIDGFTECIEKMTAFDNEMLRSMFRRRAPKEWKDREPCQFHKLGQNILSRFHKIRLTVEAQSLLSQGDALLGLATNRAREIDIEYFKFQAILALDSYRAAYQMCVGFEDVNVELEGQCLWSMGRVMGKYLGLEEHAHHLYLQGVVMVAQMTGLVPKSEWYVDSVAQIQWYRKKLQVEEMKQRERERAGMMEILTVEMMELRCRASSVADNNSLREFFGWLIRTYPPRQMGGEDVTKGILEAREICKVVLNVIALYDVRDCDDEPWVVFCEEVIKAAHFQTNADDRLLIDSLGAQELSVFEHHYGLIAVVVRLTGTISCWRTDLKGSAI